MPIEKNTKTPQRKKAPRKSTKLKQSGDEAENTVERTKQIQIQAEDETQTSPTLPNSAYELNSQNSDKNSTTVEQSPLQKITHQNQGKVNIFF